MKGSEQKKRHQNSALQYVYVSSQLLAFLGIGVFGGLKLDQMWDTSPLMIVLLPAWALAISMGLLYRQLTKDK